MRIGSNFDTNIFKEKCDYHKEKYWDNYYVTRHHIMYILKKIFIPFLFILLIISYLLISHISLNNIVDIATYFYIGAIVVLIFNIYWKYMKYMNTFFLFSPEEIIVIRQKSMFKRDVKVIHT